MLNHLVLLLVLLFTALRNAFTDYWKAIAADFFFPFIIPFLMPKGLLKGWLVLCFYGSLEEEFPFQMSCILTQAWASWLITKFDQFLLSSFLFQYIFDLLRLTRLTLPSHRSVQGSGTTQTKMCSPLTQRKEATGIHPSRQLVGMRKQAVSKQASVVIELKA